jgi:hypothetical protein
MGSATVVVMLSILRLVAQPNQANLLTAEAMAVGSQLDSMRAVLGRTASGL